MASTPLSTILARMDRWQVISTIEEQYKVRDLDEAIRTLRRSSMFPWNLKKTTLRVFADVLEYPVPSDQAEIAYLDNNKKGYALKERFRYTSLQQFYEDVDNRNDLAEIWDDNSKFIGVRSSLLNGSSVLIDSANVAADYVGTGDVTAIARDTVIVKDGNAASIRATVVNSSNVATITVSPDSLSDSNYLKKYVFLDIFLDGVPTSIELRYGSSAANYFSKTITAQFSGQAFVADDWNKIAFDLNNCTTTGTPDTGALDYFAIILNSAPTGTYYISASYLREWTILNYWYYTQNNIILSGSTRPDQEYFFNSSNVYSTDSALAGESEWCDVVQYDAMLTSLGDKENESVFNKIAEKRAKAWSELQEKYPPMTPVIITQRYRFESDPFEQVTTQPNGISSTI